eukprot:3931726-Rhodomonas_salina.1
MHTQRVVGEFLQVSKQFLQLEALRPKPLSTGYPVSFVVLTHCDDGWDFCKRLAEGGGAGRVLQCASSNTTITSVTGPYVVIDDAPSDAAARGTECCCVAVRTAPKGVVSLKVMESWLFAEMEKMRSGREVFAGEFTVRRVTRGVKKNYRQQEEDVAYILGRIDMRVQARRGWGEDGVTVRDIFGRGASVSEGIFEPVAGATYAMLLRCGQKEKIGEQARVLVDPVKRSDCRKLKNEMAGVKMKGLRVVHVGVQPPLCIVFEVEAQFDAKQVEQDVAVLQEYLTDALPPECQEELQVSALIVEQARTGA